MTVFCDQIYQQHRSKRDEAWPSQDLPTEVISSMWAQDIQARGMMTFMTRYTLRVSLRLCNLLIAERAFCLQLAACLDVLHAAVRVSVC